MDLADTLTRLTMPKSLFERYTGTYLGIVLPKAIILYFFIESGEKGSVSFIGDLCVDSLNGDLSLFGLS